MYRSRAAALFALGTILLVAPSGFATAAGTAADQICFYGRVYTLQCGQKEIVNGKETGRVGGLDCHCIDTEKAGTVNGKCKGPLDCRGETGADLGGQQQQLRPLTREDIQKSLQGSPSGSTAPSPQQNTLQPQGPNGSILNWAFNPTPLLQQSLIQSNSADNVNEQIQTLGQSPTPTFIQGIENFFSPKSTAESPTGLSGGTMLGVESNSAQTVSTPGAPPLNNYHSTETFTPTPLDANGSPVTPESPSSFQQGSSCGDYDLICKTQVALGFKPASETGAKTATLSMYNDAQCAWGPCPSTPGVAHRDLPAGTMVRVTNLDNGKTAEIPVVDRGPYYKENGQYTRDLDANPAAARALGLTQQAGLANVSYQIVSGPSQTTPISTNVLTVDTGGQGGFIQTASASGRFDTALQEGGLYQDVPLSYTGGGIGGEVLVPLTSSGAGGVDEAAFIAYAQSQQHQQAEVALNTIDSWPQPDTVPKISADEAKLAGVTPGISYAWNPYFTGPTAGAPSFASTEALPASPVAPVENGGPLGEPIAPNPTVAVTSGPLPPAVENNGAGGTDEAGLIAYGNDLAKADATLKNFNNPFALTAEEQQHLVDRTSQNIREEQAQNTLNNFYNPLAINFNEQQSLVNQLSQNILAQANDVPLPPNRPPIVVSDIPLPASRPLDLPLANAPGATGPEILAAHPATDIRLQPEQETVPLPTPRPEGAGPLGLSSLESCGGVCGQGDRGSQVKGIQQELKQLGYNVTADGIYGPQTERAVTAFQKANGLSADGMVGPQTLAKMNEVGSTPVRTPIASPGARSQGEIGGQAGERLATDIPLPTPRPSDTSSTPQIPDAASANNPFATWRDGISGAGGVEEIARISLPPGSYNENGQLQNDQSGGSNIAPKGDQSSASQEPAAPAQPVEPAAVQPKEDIFKDVRPALQDIEQNRLGLLEVVKDPSSRLQDFYSAGAELKQSLKDGREELITAKQAALDTGNMVLAKQIDKTINQVDTAIAKIDNGRATIEAKIAENQWAAAWGVDVRARAMQQISTNQAIRNGLSALGAIPRAVWLPR